MKKVLAIVLCVLMILPSLSVGAEETQKFYEVNIDSGSGVVTEKAIIDNGEIYIPASSFSKYTRFSFNPENNLFLIDGQEFSKAIKSVHIDRQNKKIRVSNTHVIGLQGYYERDNILYLPLTQMLPILNADIYEIKENVIYISNNQLSLAEVLYDFDIQDYWFNISEEFGNSTLALWWFVVPNYILDTITGCRFDRLDVTYSGNYNDYKNIFSEFLADDNLYLKALAEEPSKLNSTVELFGSTNSVAKKLKSVFGWVETAGKSDIDSNTGGALFDSLKAYYDSGELKTNDLKGLSDAWTKGDISFADYIELFTYIHTYVNQVEDHKQMLAAVYEVDKKNYSKSEDFKAAKQVYNLYGENVETAIVKEIAQMFSEEVLSELLSPISVYTATAKVAGIALKSVMPYDYGDIANLPTYSNIVLTASSKVNQYSFESDKETENKRLSLLLTLIASKRCFEIMSDSFKGYGKDNSYYENKIAKLEQMIMALYIVEENTKFDSFEHFEEYAKNNKEKIKKAISSPKEYTETATSTSLQQQVIKNDMFNNTYWLLCTGQTMGSLYHTKFYKNGTFDAVTQGGLSHGTYKVVDDKLFISVDYVKNAEFIKTNDGFRSKIKYQMQVDSGYYEIFPITEDDYLKSYQNYVNRNSTSSKDEQQQENNSNITSFTEEKTHYNEPKLGKYIAQMSWNSDDKLYVYITLNEKGAFTIESNYDLKNWKDCEPFKKNGTYILEDTSSQMDEHGMGGNITWLILYIDNEEYRTYAVGDDGTFFQDQEIVFNYTN